MAPKRPNTAEDTATARKKAKTSAARTIRIQEPPQAGPSSVSLDSMKRLPGAIQVERFAEAIVSLTSGKARAFEIDAMHNAMQNSSEHSAQRAWQALPRHLRRRAASHDPRRVPSRLRDRAKAEIDGPIRKRRHKVKKGTTTAKEFARRQRDKTWLETHVWHAKRMIMKTMWGYRLAVQPTEKSFRPSHRAAKHGSILHDASYEGPIELSGRLEILKVALEQCCDCQGQAGPAAARFADGSRTFATHLYEFQAYPFGLISPISIIWEPKDASPPKTDKGKGKGKSKAIPAIEERNGKRTVWIRCHADCFEHVFQVLQRSVSYALDVYNQKDPESEPEDVEIADLRGEVNIFEIMGPQANQVLRGALRAVPREEGEFPQFWASLKDLQTSGAVPRGMIVGFSVDDPRLRFPPKRAKPDDGAALTQTPVFPSPALASSSIWDVNLRKRLSVPKYPQKQLDERRAKNLIPGTPLNTLRQDDRVPVLLIQRSLESPTPSSIRPASPFPSSPSQPIHGWTLILPAGWAMAFLPSLVHSGTRVAGQRERAQQAFEAGVSHFPQDYPAVGAGTRWWAARAGEERARWERTPPGKRVNYGKVGTVSAWVPDWGRVLGMEVEREGEVEGATTAGEEAFVPAQREGEQADESGPPPWLLRGPETRQILQRCGGNVLPADPRKDEIIAEALKGEIMRLRARRGLPAAASTSVAKAAGTATVQDIDAATLMQTALIQVCVQMCRRGCPGDVAAIYAVDDAEARNWARALAERPRQAVIEGTDDEDGQAGMSPREIEAEDIIGYVTTGNYSLARGEGFAIGAIAFSALLRLEEQRHRYAFGLDPGLRPLMNVQTIPKVAFRQGEE
ncbi:ribonucleases P/MRP protein subunit POP1-domain-containing protein [Schizophyllum fasciatum]